MVVVTGADGQIGQALVRALVASGFKVRILLRDIHSSGFDGLGLERAAYNVLDIHSLLNGLSGAEYVFHCDSNIDLMPYVYPKLYNHNVRGTENVTYACRRVGVKRLIFFSSILAFGFDRKNHILHETVGFRPNRTLNAYSRTVALASQRVAAIRGNLETVILCPAAIVGPYDYAINNIGKLIWDYGRGMIPAYSRGGFDLVDCRDLADVSIRAALRAPSGSVYLISSGHTSVDRLMRNLQNTTGVRRPWIHLPNWMLYFVALAYEVKYRVYGGSPVYTWAAARLIKANQRASSQRLKDELGWEPRSIRQSLTDTWEWFKDHHHFV